MTSEWTTIRAADFIEFNPRLSIKKGAMATKVAMDKLQPFTKKIPSTEQAEFGGGAKFCNEIIDFTGIDHAARSEDQHRHFTVISC